MTTKHEVINMHRRNPTWTGADIAQALGCSSAYVRATARRNGIALTVDRMCVTPEQLRERAAKLIKRAEQLEAARP